MKAMVGKFLALSGLMTLVASSAFAYGGAVAIVFNPQTGAWASHHGDYNRADAEQNAINEGDVSLNTDLYSLENKLSVVRETWAINGWVALAKGTSNQTGAAVYATAGAHDSEYDAEQSALNNCQVSAYNCYVVRSLSSFVNFPDVDGVRNN